MKLTNDMLKAAIDKAVEAGLLPKYARRVESAAEREVMKLVIQAALDARPPASMARPADNREH
jgi:hypothetical protein